MKWLEYMIIPVGLLASAIFYYVGDVVDASLAVFIVFAFFYHWFTKPKRTRLMPLQEYVLEHPECVHPDTQSLSCFKCKCEETVVVHRADTQESVVTCSNCGTELYVRPPTLIKP